VTADPYLDLLADWLQAETERDTDRLYDLIWATLEPTERRRQVMRLMVTARLAMAIRALEAIAKNQVAGGQADDEHGTRAAFQHRLLAGTALLKIGVRAEDPAQRCAER
jgi:hypothetical protein